jgi:peptide/nickel transport system permease protein
MKTLATNQQTAPKGKSLTRSRALRRFFKNPLSVAGLILVIILATAAVFAPMISSHDPGRQHLFDKRSKPFGKYILGADQFGRDVLSRLIFGARVSLFVAFFSVVIALGGGMAVGTVAGYVGGAVDAVLMRFMDLLLSFPYLAR